MEVLSNMSRFRIVCLSLLAVFAVSAVVASAAFADAGQEFTAVPAKAKFTSTSGKAILRAGTITVTCQKDKDVGTVESKTTVGKVVVTFEECVAEDPTVPCKATIGTIVTESLTGDLGEDTLVNGVVSDSVGLLLTPEVVAKGFATIPESKEGTKKCNPLTKVTGNIAGEVSPVNTLTTAVTVTFALNTAKSKNAVEQLESSNDAVKIKPGLKAFGATATEETADTNVFEEAVEIKSGV
jgi:hypothetical protein